MSELDSLFNELVNRQQEKRLPPVQNWHPARTGTIDIRIDQNGVWFHEGRAIRRSGLVNVFSTVLRLDEGAYYLVTPAERLSIVVEDVPFMGVDVEVNGAGDDQQVVVSTNVDDHILLDANHPLEMRDERPYAHIRDGLYARLTRAAFYRLVDHGVAEEGTWVVYSQNTRFSLGAV